MTITLEPEVEARCRDEAAREGLTLEQITAQRLLEADLLWRIRTAAPEPETRDETDGATTFCGVRTP